jgi:molybdopterin-guanine dinucleotide biosynthesis protein A
MLHTHAVIFAGGKSSRMGKDKALLPFAQYSTLSAYQYQKLKKIFYHVSLSSKEDKFNFSCQIIKDCYKESSPLVGIISIFQTLPNVEEVFILSVDAPFITKEIIDTLMETSDKKYDAVIAKSPNGLQPLCGLYRRSILPIAIEQYKKNNHKLKILLEKASIKIVPFSEQEPFTNLNYFEEYEKALTQL